jgi:conjugative transposon TraM protein
VHSKPEGFSNEKQTVTEEENGFFGLASTEQMVVPVPASFPAIIGEDKQLVSGSSIKMTLTAPVEINGLTFDSGAAIHGICQLDGERLKIKVDQIRYENHLIPVKLEAFGMDALPGVAIPGAIGRDAAKEGLGQGIQGYSPVQPGFTLEAQIAATSVETARGFLSKKTRLKKVNVKQGHPLLLVDQA